jgi:DNA-binding CsgD family transcriptional regulator
MLATSAYILGRDLEFLVFVERAHHAHLAADDPVRAARSGFWLSLGHLLRGEVGAATGWLSRTQRLLARADCPDCVEHGFVLVPVAEQHLAEGRDFAAHRTASVAVEIGDRFGDADLVACARHLQGRSLIRQGKVGVGLAHLDEAMLAVVGGRLSPIVTGLVYCSVIDACLQVHAVGRAGEWTSALARWCGQQPQMVAFTGTCLVHRAEILHLRGAWTEAMAEVRRAGERPREGAEGGLAPASASYRQGEIHRLRGDLAAAERSFREAVSGGWEPQPGLALLWLAQGRTEAACAAIRRALGAAQGALERMKLLPAFAEITIAAGDIEAARAACRELEDSAPAVGSAVLDAMAGYARGAVELAAGDARTALVYLRPALEGWQRIDAPYDAARARVLVGSACHALGDRDGGRVEFSAARAVFERLGAVPDIVRVDALLGGAASPSSPGLTPRELEVLRHLATGKTNKAIAGALGLSERTIDRHVGNIFDKLDVRSRAAATAYAYDHGLLGRG